MNKIQRSIDRQKAKSLSGTEVLNLVGQKAKLLKYSELLKHRSIESVLEPYGSVFLLYESEPGYGHWCALTIHDRVIRFCDPYGGAPDTQLDYVSPNMRAVLGETYPYLTQLLNESKYRVEWNAHKFQQLDKDVRSCGRWSAIFILLKDLPLQDIIKLFKGADADDLATFLT